MTKYKWFMVMAIMAGLLIWKGFDVNAKEPSDARLLLSLSDQVMAGDKKVLFKQFSPYSSFMDEDDFIKTAAKLSEAFGLPVNRQLTRAEDHLAYKTTMTVDGVHGSLLYMGMRQDRSSNLVLSLETDSKTGLAHMLELQKTFESKLSSLGIPVHWNMMVQGELQGDSSAADGRLRLLQETIHAKEVERYTDQGTVSISYFSPDLSARLLTGNRPMNIQAAIHHHSVTGKPRVTLGVPVITIEY